MIKRIGKKVYFVMLLLIMTIVPTNVWAATVTVRVKTSLSSAPVAEFEAEKDVSTIADLKQELISRNFNLDNYLVLNNRYNVAANDEVLCGETLRCNGPMNELYDINLYIMPINHEEKNYTLKSIPATDEEMFRGLVDTNYELFEGLSYSSCNNTFDLCTFADRGMNNFMAYDNVVVNYQYDEGINQLAQEAVDNGLLNNTEFYATDTELLHYLNYGGTLADYTSSFKNQVSNINFKFEMDQRGGAFEPFKTNEIGFYKFLYNDTVYAIKSFMSITGNHIIYVPTDTQDVVAAIQARLQTLFGDELFLTVEESTETINEKLTASGMNTIADGDENYYIITNNNPDCEKNGMEFYFIAKKDSTKINNNVSFKSRDLITKVSVSTDETVPLDTIVNVNHISDGAEYSEIIEALDIEEGEVFDIELRSNAQNKTVRSLGNGKFLVSIPIPEKYRGKELIIYYVDTNGVKTEYTVKEENGAATFETDHFSVYTLTLNPAASNNPSTGDHVAIDIMMLCLCMMGLVGSAIYMRKKKLNK